MSRRDRALLAVGVAAMACSPGAAPGFDGPWSALHDVAADVYLVSSVNGQPLAKDGNGYISRVRPDGGMERHWLRGGGGVTLHAPKGLAIHAGVLHVADIDVVRRFDAASGAPRGETAIPGASFLDDVAVGPDGSVYVSDRGVVAGHGSATGSDAIWRIAPDGALSTLAKGEALGQPSALVARPQGLYVASWRHGGFAQVDYRGVRTELATAPTAQLAGLVRVEAAAGADWIAASQAGQCLYRFDARGGVLRLPGAPIQAGDIGLDDGRGRLLVPLFAADRLQILPLAAATGADARR